MWRGRCLLQHSFATPAKVISHTHFALELALEAPTPVPSVMPCKLSLSTITPSYSAECDSLTICLLVDTVALLSDARCQGMGCLQHHVHNQQSVMQT